MEQSSYSLFDDGNFSEFDTVLLSDLMAHTPSEVVSKKLRGSTAIACENASPGALHISDGSARSAGC
ncbi:MAG: hypothetical protein JWO13_1314 [Acidobacteriales bacterium]|nr:hypothetical protein [Terriglobales bacterium]